MTVLEEAKAHLATYGAAHTECCGTPLIRKLVAELALSEVRSDKAKQLIEAVAPQSAIGALNGDYDDDLGDAIRAVSAPR